MLARSFSEPLLAGRLINAQGFKDIVYWGSADTLYAVDSELGTLIWKKQFASPASRRCAGMRRFQPGHLDGAAHRHPLPSQARPRNPKTARAASSRTL